jgi:hypothetical protein
MLERTTIETAGANEHENSAPDIHKLSRKESDINNQGISGSIDMKMPKREYLSGQEYLLQLAREGENDLVNAYGKLDQTKMDSIIRVLSLKGTNIFDSRLVDEPSELASLIGNLAAENDPAKTKEILDKISKVKGL